MAVNVVLVTL